MKNFGLSLTLLAAAAVSGAGCKRSYDRPQEWSASAPTQLCTDANGRRVPDENCGRSYSSHGGFYPWFIGRGAYIPPMGGVFRGGSTRPDAGTAYGRAAAFTARTPSFGSVSRGGFGSSAHGVSSGG